MPRRRRRPAAPRSAARRARRRAGRPAARSGRASRAGRTAGRSPRSGSALRIDFNEHELAGRDYFLREYDCDARAPGSDPLVDPDRAPGGPATTTATSSPSMTRTPRARASTSSCASTTRSPTCAAACGRSSTRPTARSGSSIVNDGSDEATTGYLEQVAADVPTIHLIHRDHPRTATRSPPTSACGRHRRLRRPAQQRHDRHPRLARPDRRLRRVGPEHRHPRPALQRRQPPVDARAARRCGLVDESAAARTRPPTRSPSCSSASPRASARGSRSSTASATSSSAR